MSVDEQVRAFGDWDAPITDGAEWIDVPTELWCMYCRERFEPGDNGAVMPNGFAQHRECSLRSVYGGIGHLVDHERYCRSELGPDAGLTYRLSSLLVWRHQTKPVTEAELERWRSGTCQWFALCENEATTIEPHPILGVVPICDRCKALIDKL
jgi:hypothetical protein